MNLNLKCSDTQKSFFSSMFWWVFNNFLVIEPLIQATHQCTAVILRSSNIEGKKKKNSVCSLQLAVVLPKLSNHGGWFWIRYYSFTSSLEKILFLQIIFDASPKTLAYASKAQQGRLFFFGNIETFVHQWVWDACWGECIIWLPKCS